MRPRLLASAARPFIRVARQQGVAARIQGCRLRPRALIGVVTYGPGGHTSCLRAEVVPARRGGHPRAVAVAHGQGQPPPA
ncbi:hypothetical protein BHM03_00016966 [Ensete ventricosum]|nr:hypothetical protein BHM03_00016966 [Ensete ventricosum]